MAIGPKIRVGDIGTEFIAEIKDDDGVVDISAGTNLKMKFKKPDGTTVEKTAGFYTDGTDGKLLYTSIEGDIDQAGIWAVQGSLTLGTWDGKSSIYRYDVKANL